MMDSNGSQSARSFDHHIKSDTSFFHLGLKDLWHSRDMLIFLVIRDFKIRFKQSFLGVSWALLQPLCMTITFTFILGTALNVQFKGPYPIFFLSGLIAWNYFSKVLSNATLVIVNEADLIKKVYFPRLILPLYQAISSLTDVVIALVIFFLFCLYYRWPLAHELIYFPFFILLMMLLSMTLPLWLGPINVRFRDIQIIMPLLTQLLFIATPVMYPASLVSEKSSNLVSTLFHLNPMVGIIEGFRYSLLGEGDPFRLVYLISYSFVFLFFFLGIIFFNTTQKKFADVI